MKRREFLKTGTVAAAGLAMAPDFAFAAKKDKKKVAPSDKLNILGVGIGGRGASDLKEMSSQNIIGLCDVDWAYAAHVFDRYPEAKRYNDYRVMFDEMLNQADAVMVATADHTHAIICADAITAGKHVYCEKPLTHTVYESRLLTKLAKKYQVATQMGNQGASGLGVIQMCDWIWSGEIGEVRKVEAWSDRPIWPQGLGRPEQEMPVPSTLNWNAFIGPAEYRPYNAAYTPWNFRGWWDFGTGALGDMACHNVHPVFKALKLGYPKSVQGTSTLVMSDSCPSAQVVKYVFPARDNLPKVAMPEVEVTWYDGGLRPQMPAGLPDECKFGENGAIFYGSKDILVCDGWGGNPRLASGRKPGLTQNIRQVQCSHQMDWVRACKEAPEVRIPSKSDFSEAGPMNEMIVMAVLATRLQSLNQILEWDGENMRFTNIPEGAKIKSCIKDGFSVKDGHPTFNKEWTPEVDANAFAAELIKHTYHNGYKLPDMPQD